MLVMLDFRNTVLVVGQSRLNGIELRLDPGEARLYLDYELCYVVVHSASAVGVHRSEPAGSVPS